MSLPLARIDTVPDDEAHATGIQPDDGGFIATLRANLQGQSKDHDLEVALPTLGDYDTDGTFIPRVAARYRRLTGAEIETWQGSDETKLRKSADLLADACAELYAIDDGEHKPLARLLGLDAPVRFDMAFAEALGLTVTAEDGTRGVVLRAFTNREAALETHAQFVLEWIIGLRRAPERQLLGKS